MNFDAWGGTRFVLTVGSGLVNAFLLWQGKITSGDFSNIILATVSVYIGAKSYENTKVQQ